MTRESFRDVASRWTLSWSLIVLCVFTYMHCIPLHMERLRFSRLVVASGSKLIAPCSKVCNLCRTPSMTASNSYTIKGINAFGSRSMSRELMGCSFAMEAIVFPQSIVRFGSYSCYCCET